MKKVGLGIIGLGYVGNLHLRHSLRINNANLIAVADLSKSALNKARNIGVKRTYSNYEQLLRDPDIDAIIVALPTHLHLQCATQAAEAKKHIFLEKPMARNVDEAKEIIKTAQSNSVKLMVGYPLRFNTAFINLKRQIESGILGHIEVANGTYISSGPFMHRSEGYAPVPVPDWWFRKELTGGGVLIDLGTHLINLLRWYFGEITDIKSQFGYHYGLDLEDGAICLAKFDSGTTAVVEVGWFSQAYKLKIELSGTVGNATAQHEPSSMLSVVTQMLTTGTSKFYWPHLEELRYFVTCLTQDVSPSPSGNDGLKDLEAISLAYKNQIGLD